MIFWFSLKFSLVLWKKLKFLLNFLGIFFSVFSRLFCLSFDSWCSEVDLKSFENAPRSISFAELQSCSVDLQNRFAQLRNVSAEFLFCTAATRICSKDVQNCLTVLSCAREKLLEVSALLQTYSTYLRSDLWSFILISDNSKFTQQSSDVAPLSSVMFRLSSQISLRKFKMALQSSEARFEELKRAIQMLWFFLRRYKFAT